MRNSPVLFLAFRYLSIVEQGIDGRVRFAGFANKQSINSIIGLTLGVGVLLIVLSIVNGFEREMRNRVLAVIPHAILHHHYGVEDWQATLDKIEEQGREQGIGLIATAPLVEFKGLLLNNERLASVKISGVMPEREKQVSIIHDLMISGEFAALDQIPYGIILGEGLASKLSVKVGDKLKVVLPEAKISLLGVMPRYRQFEVVGVFKVGAILDEQLAYIHMDSAGKLLRNQGKVMQFRLLMPDIFSASWYVWELADKLNQNLAAEGSEEVWYASDWSQSQGSLYQIITMTKSMLGLLVLLIVLVACFNLASGLIMLVNEKRSDIAILLSQGMKPIKLLQVFVLQALIIAVLGLLVGLGLASILLNFLGSWVSGLENMLGVDLTSAYPVHYLPSQILFQDILLITLSVLVLSFLASLYPAWLASRVNPAEELKYE